MKNLKLLAVILLAGMVAASAFLGTAQADDHGKVKITITCAGNGEAAIDNTVGDVSVGSSCTSNIGSFTPSSDIDVKINAGTGVVVSVEITDAEGSQKYKVTGDASDDVVTYIDAGGDDKFDFKGDSGANSLEVNDNDAGNDKYEGTKTGAFTFTDALPATDKDKIEVNT